MNRWGTWALSKIKIKISITILKYKYYPILMCLNIFYRYTICLLELYRQY